MELFKMQSIGFCLITEDSHIIGIEICQPSEILIIFQLRSKSSRMLSIFCQGTGDSDTGLKGLRGQLPNELYDSNDNASFDKAVI